MTVYRMPAGAVLFTGGDIELLHHAVMTTMRSRQRNGQVPLRGLSQILEALSAAGQSDSTEDVDEHPEEVMTVHEAAELLSVSPRTVRRLAPRLGGRHLGGRWLLDAQAVQEHARGTQ